MEKPVHPFMRAIVLEEDDVMGIPYLYLKTTLSTPVVGQKGVLELIICLIEAGLASLDLP